MTRYRIATTDAYLRDVSRTLDWSEEQFGRLAANQYQSLITAAGRQIANDPAQPTIKQYGSESAGLFAMHLQHVQSKVRRPRHVVYFSVDEAQRVVTMRRLLHEAMDAQRHLTTHPSDQD